MAACAVGNEVYKSNANLKDRMEAAKFIIKDEKLKEVLERAKNYNFENLRYPRNKEEAETENTVIKNLLFYTNPNPLGIERKNKENIKEITE